MNNAENTLKTGTTTVGIKTKYGVVLVADKRATAGNMIVDKQVDKILPISDMMAVTTAGTVSDVQLLVKLIRSELRLKRISTGKEVSSRAASSLLSGMVYSNIRKMSAIPGISHFIFGGADNSGTHLYDIYPDGSLVELDTFVGSGSGSPFAYGVLETNYKKDMSLDEAINLGIKAVNAAIQRDSASGNGLDVVTITSKGFERVLTKMLDTNIHA